MDTLAFIVALLVFVAVGFWYVENEMKRSDGAQGLFAVRAAEKPKRVRVPRYAEGAEALRYRPRGAAAEAAAETSIAGPAPAAARYRRKERAWDRAAKAGDED
ncbi:MAG: hypothetical protein ACK4NP_00890 [Parvularculaceae bacterium]